MWFLILKHKNFVKKIKKPAPLILPKPPQLYILLPFRVYKAFCFNRGEMYTGIPENHHICFFLSIYNISWDIMNTSNNTCTMPMIANLESIFDIISSPIMLPSIARLNPNPIPSR